MNSTYSKIPVPRLTVTSAVPARGRPALTPGGQTATSKAKAGLQPRMRSGSLDRANPQRFAVPAVPAVGAKAPRRSGSLYRYKQSDPALLRSANARRDVAGLTPRTLGPVRSAKKPLFGSTVKSQNTPRNPLLTFQAVDANGNHVRGSAVGKDSRALGDKTWQKKTIDEIIRFLHENEYYRQLSRSDFPLNATEFKKVFTYVVNLIIPGYKLPEQKFEEEIPKLLKKMGYPFQASKSSFQTLGTTHSWPTVLGVLHYVVSCAAQLSEFSSSVERTAFPTAGEKGAPSDEFCTFNHLVKTYEAWNSGREDGFQEELAEFQTELMANHNIDAEDMKEQRRKKVDCDRKLKELENVPRRYEEKRSQYEDCMADFEKYQEYADKTRAYKSRKEKELADTQEKILNLVKRRESLQKSIENLTSECRERGVVDLDSRRVGHSAQILQQQIYLVRDQIQDIQARGWSKEMALGKLLEAEDQLIIDYNMVLISLCLDSDVESKLRLDLAQPPHEVTAQLKSITGKYKAIEQDVDKGLLQDENEQRKLRIALKTMRTEVVALENQHEVCSRDVSKTELAIQEEDEKLTEEINRLESESADLRKQQGRFDLSELTRQVEQVDKEVEAAQNKLDADFDRRCEKQAENIARSEEFLKKKAKVRDDMYLERERRVKHEVEENNNLVKELDREAKQVRERHNPST